MPVLPGAWSGVPSAQRGQVAGTSLVGRQVEDPQRGERVDPARCWARSGCSSRRSGRRARGSRRSRRPAPRPPGIIARSEPPVVRMSSTRTTRSPGAIVKPRRNSRRVVPSAALTSSAKIARSPSCRPVSNARITPPVVGPATRSAVGRPSARAMLRGPEAAQLARRGRVLEDLELLEVLLAVAPALEQEVAVAQGARSSGRGPRCGRRSRSGRQSRRRCGRWSSTRV